MRTMVDQPECHDSECKTGWSPIWGHVDHRRQLPWREEQIVWVEIPVDELVRKLREWLAQFIQAPDQFCYPRILAR